MFHFLRPEQQSSSEQYELGLVGGHVLLPQEVIWVGEALQQQTEHIANGGYGRLGKRGVPQGEEQPGDQLEFSQQFGIFSSLTVQYKKKYTHISNLQE